MSTHYAEPIADYWLDEIQRGKKRGGFYKRLICFSVAGNMLYFFILVYVSGGYDYGSDRMYLLGMTVLSAYTLFFSMLLSKNYMLRKRNFSGRVRERSGNNQSINKKLLKKVNQRKEIGQKLFEWQIIIYITCLVAYTFIQVKPQSEFIDMISAAFISLIFVYTFFYPMLIAMHVFNKKHRMESKFTCKEGLRFIGVLDRKNYPNLETLHTFMLRKFNISHSRILLWRHKTSEGVNIDCNYYQKRYHLIMSGGFLKILCNDFEAAKVIYAHELSHIRLHDPENLVYQKFFAKAWLLFVQIPAILMCAYTIIIFFSSEYLLPANYLVSSSWSFIWTVYAAFRVNKKAFDSERNADIGAALLCGTGKLENALHNYSSALNFYKKIIANAPNKQWRLEEVNILKQYFPGLSLIKDESQSEIPALEELV